MDFGLQGKTALVLGAGGGLGRAIAVALAREGAAVALGDIDEAALQATANDIAALGGRSFCEPWQLSDLDAIDSHIQRIEAALGPIDILVNNTGGPPPSTAHSQSSQTWATHFHSMVLSVIAITDRVLPKMRERGWGRIVTSASSGVIAPIPNLGISNTLRMSLVGWSKTLAREVARDGITSNIVVPGRIATARIRQLDQAKATREGRTVESVAQESTQSIPVGRYGEPHEYADAIAFLASERASYITGSTLRVDGGLVPSV